MAGLVCEAWVPLGSIARWITSWELTYPGCNGIFEDYFPFSKVGDVSSLRG